MTNRFRAVFTVAGLRRLASAKLRTPLRVQRSTVALVLFALVVSLLSPLGPQPAAANSGVLGAMAADQPGPCPTGQKCDFDLELQGLQFLSQIDPRWDYELIGPGSPCQAPPLPGGCGQTRMGDDGCYL